MAIVEQDMSGIRQLSLTTAAFPREARIGSVVD
jgi:hypothetical protein